MFAVPGKKDEKPDKPEKEEKPRLPKASRDDDRRSARTGAESSERPGKRQTRKEEDEPRESAAEWLARVSPAMAAHTPAPRPPSLGGDEDDIFL
jgi:hypothetical protein